LKADGRQRPLGIAVLEDKIVHQAVVTIPNQTYEVDFKASSDRIPLSLVTILEFYSSAL
jgi:hypothetical protein